MTDGKPEYLQDTDAKSIEAINGENDTTPPRDNLSPEEDAGSPGGTGGTGGTNHEQDD